MAETLQDRIHPPTPRRRKKAREAGHVARSADLTAVIMLGGGLLAVVTLGHAIFEQLMRITRENLGSFAATSLDATAWFDRWQQIVLGLGKVAIPALAVAVTLPILAHLIQTRFLFRPASAIPDWTRIDPARGFQRILSGEGAVRTGFGVVKVLAVGSVVLLSLYGRHEEIAAMTAMTTNNVAATMFNVLLSVLMQTAAALLFLAVLDYFYQRWKYERGLMMTAEEMREELRDDRPRPAVAAGRRAARQQIAGGPAPLESTLRQT